MVLYTVTIEQCAENIRNSGELSKHEAEPLQSALLDTAAVVT